MKFIFKNAIISACMVAIFNIMAVAQEYVSPLQPAQTGRSPGLKVKLLSTNGKSKTYVLVFSPGDEIRSGLTEFAQKYSVKSAHYTAIGGVYSAKVGFFNYDRNMFKVIPVDTAEIASLTGNISLYNGRPAVHSHISLAVEDGTVRGGHLIEAIVSVTVEMLVNVEQTPVVKKLDKRFNAAVIDLSQEK